MKILFLCHNLTGGGAERVCASLAYGLSEKGHSVSILTDLNQPITYNPGSKVKLIQQHYSGRNLITRRISVYKYMRRVILRETPDVIISIQPYFTEIARLITWLHYNCPIIMTEHDAFEWPSNAPMPFKKKFNKFWMNHLYEYITVLTKPDYDIAKKYFKHVSVMHNPLFLEPVDEVSPKEKIVLAVGRIDDWHYKGFDILIKDWNQISKKYPHWKLRIIGKGGEANINYLKSLSSNLETLEIKPYTSDIELEYKKAAIFVLSSRYEGFGLVLIEAMSQGCACIACDYKGRQSEIVNDGLDGLLCDVEDIQQLSDKIAYLIDNDVERIKLQNNAIVSVSKFSIQNIVDEWNVLLNQLH